MGAVHQDRNEEPDDEQESRDLPRPSPDNSPEASQPEQQPVESLDRFEQFSKHMSDIARGARGVLGLAFETVAEGAVWAATFARDTAVAVTCKITGVVITGLDKGLSAIAADPDAPKSTLRELLKLAPGIGATTEYADARALYLQGKELGDEAKMHEGRVGCLIAMSSAGIDIASFGVGRLLKGARAAKYVSAGIHVASGVSRVGPDPARILAEKVLKYKLGVAVVDVFLNAVKPPDKPSQDGEKQLDTE